MLVVRAFQTIPLVMQQQTRYETKEHRVKKNIESKSHHRISMTLSSCQHESPKQPDLLFELLHSGEDFQKPDTKALRCTNDEWKTLVPQCRS